MAEQSASQPNSIANHRSLTWYLVWRTAVVTFLLGGAAVFYLKGSIGRIEISPLFILIGATYAEALLSALLLRVIVKTDLFAQFQIAWDLLFVTALILLTGGIESVFPFAYLLVVVSASFLLSRRMTVLAAAAAVIFFGGLLDLQYFAYLESLGLTRAAANGTYLSTLFVHATAFLLTAFLSGTLAERWRTSEAHLQRKTIDFTELEKLNQTMLAHINSGLMLINPGGRIRSFNRAAGTITGLTLAAVYDRPAAELFPGFSFAQGESVERVEGSFAKADGTRMILGYSTTAVRDSQGGAIGTLVTFQDLTQLKRYEEDLKRADRLAAVGRLSAAMAHEIRNPLASISGSVQLLLENVPAQGEEQRLMRIVVNEADRLNGLLSDFLTFARPRPPQKTEFDLPQLLQEFIDLLHRDQRFSAIQIDTDWPAACPLNADLEQLKQSLWDLAINAAEAMQGRGALLFQVVVDETISIVVEDSGPGISADVKARIFEPFFSTKERGTGLGLASVYVAMEAHNGQLTVTDGTQGGACFRLSFPRVESDE